MLTLYSTGCPKCKILKSKLDEKNIQYEICTDTQLMLQKNFRTVPLLETDEKIMAFDEAIKWIKEI